MAGILPGSYKDHFLVGLRSKDVAVSAAAVRVLCGLLHNKSVDPEVLDAAGAEPSLHVPVSLKHDGRHM